LEYGVHYAPGVCQHLSKWIYVIGGYYGDCDSAYITGRVATDLYRNDEEGQPKIDYLAGLESNVED
jgi:hypothetical protein